MRVIKTSSQDLFLGAVLSRRFFYKTNDIPSCISGFVYLSANVAAKIRAEQEHKKTEQQKLCRFWRAKKRVRLDLFCGFCHVSVWIGLSISCLNNCICLCNSVFTLKLFCLFSCLCHYFWSLWHYLSYRLLNLLILIFDLSNGVHNHVVLLI